VQVEVISFGRSSSSKLKEVTEDFIDMCDHPDEFLISQGRNGAVKRGVRALAPKRKPYPAKEKGEGAASDTSHHIATTHTPLLGEDAV
jgi:hypothetical protein